MNVLLGFLPFVAFGVLSGPLGTIPALFAGAAVAAVLVLRGQRAGAAPKILEVGTLALFVVLGLAALLLRLDLPLMAVRLCVDLGLLAIILTSLAIRRPFTIQYAKEEVPATYWDSPQFLHVNMVISAGWAVAILVMVLAESAVLLGMIPQHAATLVIVGALVGAVLFTKRRAAAA
ncbi:hypothetical protein GXW78_12985 [Roseomonas terrae]|uniref:Intracellular septation protein A n=1 Tax=Neoroseomonas terrae TaxID=424799 RepID=A0ABS5EHS6_9PROT|nr:hypothetical protein [Neoroseomonas terrae]MBR0650583.1 hypothetical protein [Neoroseomonas terrae]